MLMEFLFHSASVSVLKLNCVYMIPSIELLPYKHQLDSRRRFLDLDYTQSRPARASGGQAHLEETTSVFIAVTHSQQGILTSVGASAWHMECATPVASP